MGRAPLPNVSPWGFLGLLLGLPNRLVFHMATFKNDRFVAQISPRAFRASRWAFEIGVFFIWPLSKTVASWPK